MSARDPSDDRDGIGDELRELWRAFEPPEPDAPSADPSEGAAAAWMRAAWDALEAPPVPDGAAMPFAPRRRRARLAPLALATGLSGLAAAAVLALVVSLHERALRHADAPPAAAAVPRAETIEVAAIEDGRMELRSGPVRLILLDAWTEGPAPRADAR